MGGHRYDCDHCDYTAVLNNSCGNRYCPQCQGPRRHRWAEAQQELLLPVPHFQVVFTLPAELRPIARAFPSEVYDALFQAAQETLQKLAKTHWDATLGVLAVLHTWARDLSFHPHVHCVVSGGGLTADGGWVASEDFLFHEKQLKKLFKGLFLTRLTRLCLDLDRNQRRRLAHVRKHVVAQDWVVFVEAADGRGKEYIVKYLARYVYQAPISDVRIVAITDTTVTFRTREEGIVTLPGTEFVRRFAMHFLPKGFRKVRHYGLLAPANRPRLEQARAITEHALLARVPDSPEVLDAIEPSPQQPNETARPIRGRCPICANPLRDLRIPRDPGFNPCARAPP